ncbi:MAG TPA: DUF5686 and carboxypeptidase regulatory-like domain-containing protein [Bacteroidales bacterium]|nr:DUF5686 and carboxypeptidase regulatory-like domain-containing protein [Bacteroidales bacterium]
MIRLFKHNRFFGSRLIIQIILLFLFFSNPYITAQILKGRITEKSGEAVQYATVFIQELKQGTTSNTKGDYEIRLPEGKYLVIYQSLGYDPVFVNINLTDSTLIKDVVLQEQYYEIPEVRITASGEDPAYYIMRKAIGLAPYYLNNISYYKADVYLKGSLVINRIPKIMERSMRVEARSSSSRTSVTSDRIKEGDSYLMESYNEIEFTAPDNYVQKVISFNSTFPEQGNEISPMDFIQASFYQPVLVDMAISPLSPQAFSYYNFKYLGASPQGNFTINKIQVIPKRKSQQLFRGTIFIIDDLWCLHSIDLINENLAGKIRVQQLYIPVQDEIWMPVSHKFEINIGIFGFRADGGYGSSVKYVSVKPNPDLQKPKSVSTDLSGRSYVMDTAMTRTKQQIERILEKDELTNRDMIRLAKLMEKESEGSVKDSSRTRMEVKEKTTYVIEKDAAGKDSTYWANIRPIPLSDLELRSLRISDSIRSLSNAPDVMKGDTSEKAETKKKSQFRKTLSNIASGYTWSDTSGFSFTSGGLINLKKLSFNTVDGFVFGTDFRISKSWKNNRRISVYPDVSYTTAREKIMWRINANYSFGGIKMKQIFIRSGITSKDLNNDGGINTFLNTFSSLVLRRNYLKLYESGYFALGYRTEVVNGLNLELSANYDDRRVLFNNTDFSLFKPSREYTDNIPDNEYLEQNADPGYVLLDQRHLDFVTNVTFTPFRKYSVRNSNKVPMGSDWPTFILTWKHGINELSETPDKYQHFDMFRFEVHRKRDAGAFSEFRWRAAAGGFLNKINVTYYDFFHFNSQPLQFLLDNYEDVFMLSPYYSLSTPEFFGEFHLKYTTPYLLLKLLPGLSNTLMRENLSFSYFGSRFHSHYTEIGYTLSEIFLVGEAGVYAGFDNLKYKSFGIKLILRLN